MPKVSASYEQRQTARIVDAARRCFARRGFHATSMDEIIAEVGMSSSTVYRYFPDGKQSLIVAVVRGWTEPLVAWLDSLETDPPESVEDLLTHGIQHGWSLKDADGSASLVLDIWGEGVRTPELSDRFATLYLDVRRAIVATAQRLQDEGRVTRSIPAADIAALLHNTALGLTMERALGGELDVGPTRALARLLAPEG